MEHLKKTLIRRLQSKGVESTVIPGFMRSLANSVFVEPRMSILQINKRLQYLGWDEINLDYHTLQLAMTCLEDEGVKGLEHIQSYWFENIVSSRKMQLVSARRPNHPVKEA